MADSTATPDQADRRGPILPKLRARVLREDVLAALRKAILTEEMATGSRLLEADVASQMGVSRAPVREALRQLEQEGLIQFAPHRGAVVVGLPEAEIDAIYEMRAVIEGRAMAAVSQTLTEEQDAQLMAFIEEMKGPLKRGDIEAVAEIDWRLHGLIVELSDFTLLRRTWSSLDGLVRLRSYQALGRPGVSRDYFLGTAIKSHEDLVMALRSGDADVADHAGREHVLEVARVLATDRATHTE